MYYFLFGEGFHCFSNERTKLSHVGGKVGVVHWFSFKNRLWWCFCLLLWHAWSLQRLWNQLEISTSRCYAFVDWVVVFGHRSNSYKLRVAHFSLLVHSLEMKKTSTCFAARYMFRPILAGAVCRVRTVLNWTTAFASDVWYLIQVRSFREDLIHLCTYFAAGHPILSDPNFKEALFLLFTTGVKWEILNLVS